MLNFSELWISQSREHMVRFARHGTNEVCGVECKSAVFYGTELSNPQSSSIGEMYRGNILEGISLPQAASRFSNRNMQKEMNQFQMLNFIYIIFNMTAGSKNYWENLKMLNRYL